MHKLFISIFTGLLLLSSCTIIRNGNTSASDSKIVFFNTGLLTNGEPSDYLNDIYKLSPDDSRDNKWAFCMVNYEDLNPYPTNYSNYNFKCTNSKSPLVRPDMIEGISLITGVNVGLLQTNGLFRQSKFIVADTGRIIHSTPYFHIFSNGFCLTKNEKSNAEDIKLNIQSFDSPIISIIFNNVVIWHNSSGTNTNQLMNFVINKSNLITGQNELRIVTIKNDYTRDNDLTNDLYSRWQFGAIDVSGYLKINKCCN
jgi:hypothetical protein